jgi:hypothetical protein
VKGSTRDRRSTRERAEDLAGQRDLLGPELVPDDYMRTALDLAPRAAPPHEWAAIQRARCAPFGAGRVLRAGGGE